MESCTSQPASHSFWPLEDFRPRVLSRVEAIHISTLDRTLLPALAEAVLTVAAPSAASAQTHLPPLMVESLTPMVVEPLPPGLRFSSGGSYLSEALLPAAKRAKVSTVTVPSQRDRRTMSRRRGQRGSVRAVGEKYIGRYWTDVPGSTKRVRKAVEIGSIDEMTKSEAKRWLADYIEEQGVNSAAHLARSQSSAVTFGDAAELWRQRQLIACGKPSSRSSMGCELRKHVVPLAKSQSNPE